MVEVKTTVHFDFNFAILCVKGALLGQIVETRGAPVEYCNRSNSNNMSRHETLWYGSGAKMSRHEWLGVVRHRTDCGKPEFWGIFGV